MVLTSVKLMYCDYFQDTLLAFLSSVLSFILSFNVIATSDEKRKLDDCWCRLKVVFQIISIYVRRNEATYHDDKFIYLSTKTWFMKVK